jgi:hypothetical protein
LVALSAAVVVAGSAAVLLLEEREQHAVSLFAPVALNFKAI